MGKSALLDYVSDRADGWHVATAVGVESEMELAYSGLHQLCAPMLERLDRLPVPQRDALATVFGLSAGPAPDRFLVGLATLTLFAEVAETAAARLHRRRRAVARPRLGADPRLRRPTAPRRADRDRVRGAHGQSATTSSPGFPSCRSTGSATTTRARCCWTTSTARSTPRSAIRSSRRATATRSRCWSCRARGTPPSWPAGSGFPAASRWPARSNRATPERLARTSVRHPAARPRRGGGAARRPGAPRAGPPRPSASASAAGRTRQSTPACSRSERGSSSRTRSSAPPPTATASPTTATGCIAPSPKPPIPRRTRTGAPGTAPSATPARRAGGRRARALGRPGAGTRRGRGRRRVPAARRHAHRRPGAPRRARAGGRAGQPQAGAFDTALALLADGRGRTARRRSNGARASCVARSPSFTPQSARRAAAAPDGGRERSSRSTSTSRATTYLGRAERR